MSPSSSITFWTEFLELYQSLPALWRIKSEEYNNRLSKANAYQKMIDKFKEIDPDANRDKVIRKINTFRCNYRRDLQRTKKSLKSATRPNDVFKSTLWYYDLLSFLEDQKIGIVRKIKVAKNDAQPTQLTYKSSNTPGPSKRKGTLPKKETFIKMTCACDHSKSSKDDADILAKGWSTQYNQLSTKQKIFTRKIISDVFFNGCLERLNENKVREIQIILDKN